MKKIVAALALFGAFSTTASAADLAARPYTKAPVAAAPAFSWTGCNINGGIGYGWFTAESRQVDPVTGAFIANEGDTGGRGWLGQLGAGCDYQFAGPLGNWVIGLTGDYNWSNVHGDHVGAPFTSWIGNLKEDSSWAVGGRVGYLVNPTFLTYFGAGYTQAHFKSGTYNNYITGLPGVPAFGLQSATFDGWYLSSGFEYALNFLPGLFLKSEYRYSEFDRKQLNVFDTTGAVVAAETIKPFTQSVTTSVVYHFNWTGPVVAKY